MAETAPARDRAALPGGSRAIVLGPEAVARQVASDLVGLGIEAVTVRQAGLRAPGPGEPGAVDRLRETLRAFPRGSGAATFVHPGASSWVARTELIQVSQELGLVAVMPPARSLRIFGDRLSLLLEADRLGMRHLVLSFDPVHGAAEAARLGVFPLALRSVRNGLGPDLFVAQGPGSFDSQFSLWLEQLARQVGAAILLAERHLEGGRLIRVPFVRRPDGAFEAFPASDASLQARGRPLLELVPADVAPETLRDARDWARRLAEAAGYVGFGSVDFMVDGERTHVAGATPGLSGAYRAWEAVSRAAFVGLQLECLGWPGSPASRPPARVAVSLALRAEDPLLHLPQPGLVWELSEKTQWSVPGAGAVLDWGVESGLTLERPDDVAIGVLTAWGDDRQKALSVARGALAETWFAGEACGNERLLAELLRHPWVREGIFHAYFVDEELAPALAPPPELARAAALACAEAAGDSAATWVAGEGPGRLVVKAGTPDWTSGPVRSKNGAISGWLQVAETGERARLCAFPLEFEDLRWRVRVGEWVIPVRRLSPPRPGDPTPVRALVSGRIHAILYRAGARVPVHETALVIEALGQLVPHSFPVDVTVEGWRVRPEDRVRTGQRVADVRPERSAAV